MTMTHPMSPGADRGETAPLLELEIDGPDSQRRITVAFRLLLIIPQVVALLFLGIAAEFVTVVGWFAALVLGRLPEFAVRFLSGYLGYAVRVTAYLNLLVDRYPPFSFDAPDYPVRIALQPTRLNRLAVLFRIILIIPAYLVASILTIGLSVCSFFLWVTVLINGKTPTTVFGATAAVVRYSARFQAYATMLTSAYPRGVFGASPGSATQGAEAHRGTRPLILSKGARVLLTVFIVAGVLEIGNATINAHHTPQQLRHIHRGNGVTPG